MHILDEKYIDVIREFVNIGMGKSADTLNQIINCHIKLNVPELKIIEYKNLAKELRHLGQDKHASINISFHNDLNGTARLIFPTASATQLVKLFVGDMHEPDQDLNAIRVSALTEIGNIIINTIIGTISNQLNIEINYTVPDFIEGDIHEVIDMNESHDELMVLYCRANFTAEKVHIKGSLVMFFNIGKFGDFMEIIDAFYSSIS